ncbi:MAG: hypothetical protein R3C03_02075 [Pirellulaceae bacterium]
MRVRNIAAACYEGDGDVFVWVRERKNFRFCRLKAGESLTSSVAVAGRQHLIFSGDVNGGVHCWEAGSVVEIANVETGVPIRFVALSDDATRLICIHDHPQTLATIWDVQGLVFKPNPNQFSIESLLQNLASTDSMDGIQAIAWLAHGGEVDWDALVWRCLCRQRSRLPWI